MKITRLYSGPDGQSHFQDLDMPLKDNGEWGFLSESLPVRELILRETTASYDFTWHNAPVRQYMIILSGQVDIEIGDGTIRRFAPGDIVLLEDLTGQGHISRAVNKKPRSCVFITI